MKVKEGPKGPVRVIEVISRGADNIPKEFRDYYLGSPAQETAGKRRAGLGQQIPPGSIPESVAEREHSAIRPEGCA
jgi:hypothetical protein